MSLLKSSQTKRLLFLLFPLLFLSCSPVIKSVSLPEETLDILSPRWEKLFRPDFRQDTLKAIARLDINDREKRYPLKVALLLKRPSLIRLEGIPIMGPADFFLSVNSDTLKVFIPEKNVFYLGRSSRENISRFIPIDVPPEDLVSVLMGLPPISGNKPRLCLAGEKHYLELSLDNKKIKTVSLEMDDDRLTKMEIMGADGELQYVVNYSDYRKVGEIDRPYQIILSSNRTSLTLRYSEMEFDKVDEASFDLSVPSRITPTIIDRDSRPPGIYE